MAEGWGSALANLPWGTIGKAAMFAGPKALQMFPSYSPAARIGGALNPIADYTAMEYLTGPERERAKAFQDEQMAQWRKANAMQEFATLVNMGYKPVGPGQQGTVSHKIGGQDVSLAMPTPINPAPFYKAISGLTGQQFTPEQMGGTSEQQMANLPMWMQIGELSRVRNAQETQAKGLETFARPDWSGVAGQEAYVKPRISSEQAQYGAGEIRAGRPLPAQVSESLWQQLGGEGQDPFKRLAELEGKLGPGMTATVPLGVGPRAGQASIKARSQEEVTSIETAKNTASKILANPTEVQRIQARPGGTVLLGLLQGAAKGNVAAFNTVATALLAPDAAPADEFARLITPYLRAGASDEEKAFAAQAIHDRIDTLRGKGRANLNQEGQLVQFALNNIGPGPMRNALMLDLQSILNESRHVREGRQGAAAGKSAHPEDQAIADTAVREGWTEERTRAELEKARAARQTQGAQ